MFETGPRNPVSTPLDLGYDTYTCTDVKNRFEIKPGPKPERISRGGLGPGKILACKHNEKNIY